MRRVRVATMSEDGFEVPVEFAGLHDLAYNLWWTWSVPAQRLFARIDPERWRYYHNPVQLLLRLPATQWERLRLDESFVRDYHEVLDEFERYMADDTETWFDRSFPEYRGGPFAYFSTEFGWHDSLGIYSGGLGILSGDHCKSASDEGIPFLGVGLMYHRGYFKQTIDPDGFQQHFYPNFDLGRLPLQRVADEHGRELRIGVELAGREVQVRAWKAQVGRVPVLLLDTDIEVNAEADRPITSILYVQGREMRLCQEALLGIGGVQLLRRLDVAPAVWHMNEGHSAFLALHRIEERMGDHRVEFDEALRRSSGNVVFTTHTPVPAGNENFEPGLIRHYFEAWAGRCGIDGDRLLEMGRAQPDSDDHRFNLTALAIRTSSTTNGVSELHGRIADGLWRHLFPGAQDDGQVVGHVTNGVHTSTWIGPDVHALLQRHLGREFEAHLLDPGFADGVMAIPDREVWDAHMHQKQRLVEFARTHVQEQFARHGRSPGELEQAGSLLDAGHLTVGFARRFATYKRASLIFRDLERLITIVGDDQRPLQILFAGKAHPADRAGQDFIRQICVTAHTPGLKHRILFLENYNMRIARYLVQGVDVWLNTPRRPQEASGTSGMKVAVNGGLNCSILDGWWCEGYDASHGWAIGDARDWHDDEAQDADDANSLYGVLSNEVVPAYYERDPASGLPLGWIERMKRAIAELTPRFSTSRMLRDYTEQYYVPASGRQGWGTEIDEVRLWSP